jgi:hypothetical protein
MPLSGMFSTFAPNRRLVDRLNHGFSRGFDTSLTLVLNRRQFDGSFNKINHRFRRGFETRGYSALLNRRLVTLDNFVATLLAKTTRRHLRCRQPYCSIIVGRAQFPPSSNLRDEL